MKICFSADQKYLESLQADVVNLKQTLKLPCEVHDVYRLLSNLRENSLASTFYGAKEIMEKCPVIEFSSQYFEYNDYRRKIVLLHEIIHAYQRYGSLSELNLKFLVDSLRQFKSEIEVELKLQIDTKYKKFLIKQKPMFLHLL